MATAKGPIRTDDPVAGNDQRERFFRQSPTDGSGAILLPQVHSMRAGNEMDEKMNASVLITVPLVVVFFIVTRQINHPSITDV